MYSFCLNISWIISFSPFPLLLVYEQVIMGSYLQQVVSWHHPVLLSSDPCSECPFTCQPLATLFSQPRLLSSPPSLALPVLTYFLGPRLKYLFCQGSFPSSTGLRYVTYPGTSPVILFYIFDDFLSVFFHFIYPMNKENVYLILTPSTVSDT